MSAYRTLLNLCLLLAAAVCAPAAAQEAGPFRLKGDLAQARATRIAITADSGLLAATPAGKGEVAVWNVAEGQVIAHLAMHGPVNFIGPQFSADGKQLVIPESARIGGAPDRVRLMRLLEVGSWKSLAENFEYRGDPASPIRASADLGVLARESVVNVLVYSRDGSLRKTLRYESAGRQQASKDGAVNVQISDIAVRPDGKEIAAAVRVSKLFRDAQGSVSLVPQRAEIHLWDVEAGIITRKLDGPLGRIRSLSYSEDGYLLAAVPDYAGFVSDKRVVEPIAIFEAATGRVLARLAQPSVADGGRVPVRALTFAGSRSLLVTACDDDRLRVWSVHQARIVQELAVEAVTSIAYASKAGVLAAAGARQVRLWTFVQKPS